MSEDSGECRERRTYTGKTPTKRVEGKLKSPRTPAVVTSGDGSLSIACDFGEKHIRTVGRSLRKATTSFVAARARAAITGNPDDQEMATARRLDFDNQVEAVSAFTRAAAKKEAPVSHLQKALDDADKAVAEGPEGETNSGRAQAEIHPSPKSSRPTNAYDDDQTITSDEDDGTSTQIGGGTEAPDYDGPDYERSTKEGSVGGSQRSLSPNQIAANHARRDASLNREEETVSLQSELEALRDEMDLRDAAMRRDMEEIERRDAATRREFKQKEIAIKARLKRVEQKRDIARKRSENDLARDEAMSQASGSVKSSRTTHTALTSVSQQPPRNKPAATTTSKKLADMTVRNRTVTDKPKTVGKTDKSITSKRPEEIARPTEIAAWAEDAASRTSRKDIDEERGSDRASLTDLVSSAAAAAAVAAVARQNHLAQNTSIYEWVKLIERRRPPIKFEGDSKVVDFEDHFITFKRSVDLPGLPATWKLAEIPHWFGGVARVHINRFLRREDADKAFEEAMDRLKREFGRKAATADEMLTDVLKGNKIDIKDASGANLFISRVEEIYHLALETHREEDFNRRSIYKRILLAKLPHLKAKWGAFVGKNDEKTMTFVEFLEFLTISRRIATECDDLDDEPVETTKTFATVVKDVAKENVGSDGFEVVRRKGGSRFPRSFDSTKVADAAYPTSSEKPEDGERRPRTLECFCCKQEHYLQFCPKFINCTQTERLSLVKEKGLCHRCLGKGHRIKDCTSRMKCHCGSANHHPTTHEGRDITADTATPAMAGVTSES